MGGEKLGDTFILKSFYSNYMYNSNKLTKVFYEIDNDRWQNWC